MTTQNFHVTHDEQVSDAVVRAVASVEGVGPAELDPKLFDAVDPDALDRLFDGDRSTVDRVTFTYCDHEVAVHADGRLELHR